MTVIRIHTAQRGGLNKTASFAQQDSSAVKMSASEVRLSNHRRVSTSIRYQSPSQLIEGAKDAKKVKSSASKSPLKAKNIEAPGGGGLGQLDSQKSTTMKQK